MHEKQQFMNGEKNIAIISEAGSAGVSLHADRRAKNQVVFLSCYSIQLFKTIVWECSLSCLTTHARGEEYT